MAQIRAHSRIWTPSGCGFLAARRSGGYSAHPKRDPELGGCTPLRTASSAATLCSTPVIGVDGAARRTVDITVHGSPMSTTSPPPDREACRVLRPAGARPGAGCRDDDACCCGLPARLMMSALIGRVRIPIRSWRASPPTAPRSFIYRWNLIPGSGSESARRDGGDVDVRWFEVEPRYVFHPMNAYDDGDTIVLMWCGTRGCSTPNRLGNEGPPTLDRVAVDPPTARFGNPDRRSRPGVPRVDERLRRQAASLWLRPAVRR